MKNYIGQTINRYKVIEKLGEGGMASVFKAFDPQLDRFVAIKIILPEKGISEKFLKRFEREAKALAALNHKNIIPIIDYGEFEGLPYLVMPYISGGTLKQKMTKPIPYAEAAKLLSPIANALAYAHKEKIIHRDVKPSNILIDETGALLLSDFGVAKIIELEETIDLTGTGAGVGTPEYMSPEQTMGKPVDGRSDGYSLGIIFYELITGQKPYQADTPLAVAIKKNTEPIPSPRIFIPLIPEAVEKVILKSLAKNPDSRYQTLELFQKELDELAKGNFQKQNEKKTKYKFSKTGSWSIIVGGIVLAAVLLFVFILPLDKPSKSVLTPTPTITNTMLVLPSQTATMTPVLPTNTPTLLPIPTLGIGSDQISLKDQMEMVFVPAGKFIMGSPEGEGDLDEQPEHEVFLDAFWIDKTEVTNSMFQKCVDSGYCVFFDYQKRNSSNTREKYSSDPAFANFPVVNIDFNLAEKYCAWAGKRLPTEAEWEKAAGGGEKSVYPWGTKLPDATLANFNKNNYDTVEVGSYPAGISIYGALDMAGNVWEWVSDKYDSGFYQKSPPTNPQGSTDERLYAHVLRGGSFLSNSYSIRNSKRSVGFDSSLVDVGFRCAASESKIFPTKTPEIATPTKEPNVGKTEDAQKDSMILVFVPKGKFLMGSNEESVEIESDNNYMSFYQNDNLTDENPIHEVNLDDFWIDKTEVTNAMFQLFINETNYKTTAEESGSSEVQGESFSQTMKGAYWRKPQGPLSGLGGLSNHPVVHISWFDAKAYCEWAGRRLPTEAEWEKSARGIAGSTYPWGEILPSLNLANYTINGDQKIVGKTTSVASYPDGISFYGAYDMAGNVSEWVSDFYDADYYASSSSTNPGGPNVGKEGVLRGGSWAINASYLRTASRINRDQMYHSDTTGFRCAMDAN